LLPEIETARALIVMDAANFGGAPGEVRVFDEEAMDAQLGAAKTSAHELVLADLIGAARLSGSRPERRALVGIAPASVGWGLEPTPEVAASIPLACAEIEGIIERSAA
jgi:hydrogenase maturation protease